MRTAVSSAVGLRPLAVVVAALVLAATPLSRTPSPNAGLGRITFPTSGPASVQPAFERGVLLLHSFEYDDAIAAPPRGAAPGLS